MNKLFVKIGIFSAIVFLISCGGDSSPGYEFMPNMYRSPSIETYGEHIVLPDTSYMIEGYTGIPVKGTIAKGYLSTFDYEKDTSVDDNSWFLNAGDSAKYPEEFDGDENDLEKGEELYGMMCAHCHGPTGGGDGKIALATFANNPYDIMPAFNDSEKKRPRNNLPMTDFTEGHIFHTITYGYGKMGPHASQISEKERWKIVYYIQEKLQK